VKKEPLPRSLKEIGQKFRDDMAKLMTCKKCGKPNGTMSISFGGGQMNQLTPDATCTCPSTSR
jgi:hypothetical protein